MADTGKTVEVEIDGRTMEVAEGATIMDAANQAGIYVPHFCYAHQARRGQHRFPAVRISK